MAISYTHSGVRHAKALLSDVAALGVTPPSELTNLTEGFDELAGGVRAADPAAELIKAVAAGQLRGDALDERIAAAAASLHVREFRDGIKGRVEPVLVKEFVRVLNDGAADAIITALTPAFDKHAKALQDCAELVNPGVDAETFLAGASAKEIKAWQAIDEHVAGLTRIAGVVGHFGPHSPSWPLIEIPANVGPPAGFVNNAGIMCVDPKFDIQRSCDLFRAHGLHRNSPWFKGASVIRLNTLAEAREKVRVWAESAWDGLSLNQGRGRMVAGVGFVADPIANPYALPEGAEVNA